MISPYIDGSKNVSQYNASTSKQNVVTLESHEREWDAIFAGIKGAVDIVAFQDGHVEYDELVDFLKVNKKLADRYGLECWTNSETFDRDMPSSSCRSSGRNCGSRWGWRLRPVTRTPLRSSSRTS